MQLITPANYFIFSIWISSDTFFPTYNLLKLFFHFSGPHIQLPCCGISFYDFAVCASIQLIFPCGFCHSWTNIVFAKVRWWSFFFLSKIFVCLFICTTKETRKGIRKEKSEWMSTEGRHRITWWNKAVRRGSSSVNNEQLCVRTPLIKLCMRPGINMPA